MDASNIIKRKNNNTIYSAYTNISNVMSNPNTRQNILETYYNNSSNQFTNIPKYTCDNFINFKLQKDVFYGGKTCGNHTIQDICGNNINTTTVQPYACPEAKLEFTTGPTVICPNIQFYQGTNFTNE